jgi:putative cardiolipin synthase
VDDDNITVNMIVEKLLLAADRGVRVRLLFDDYGTTLSDSTLHLLDSHPNIEVRLFNPLYNRTPGAARNLEMVGSFSRFDHRMHNKAFIADGIIGIVGGRNLGDAYFGAREDLNFADLDVVAAGPVVRDISREFDLYWNCPWGITLDALKTKHPDEESLKKARRDIKDKIEKSRDSKYAVRVRESDYFEFLVNGKGDIRTGLIWGRGTVLYDLPEKAEGSKVKNQDVYLLNKLLPMIRDTGKELILVAPYFIPGKKGLEFYGKLRDGGMKVRVFTNSLASTDEVAVYGGYSNYRIPLLQKGVELYEMRVDSPQSMKKKRSKVMGTSSGGLHAKFYVFDRKAAFIGSRNLDNRSNRLNTEIGIFVESPEIAGKLGEMFDSVATPQVSYKLGLNKDGKTTWTAEDNGAMVTCEEEPMTSYGLRSSAEFYSVFAPESEL